jgi:hypothetical protein
VTALSRLAVRVRQAAGRPPLAKRPRRQVRGHRATLAAPLEIAGGCQTRSPSAASGLVGCPVAGRVVMDTTAGAMPRWALPIHHPASAWATLGRCPVGAGAPPPRPCEAIASSATIGASELPLPFGPPEHRRERRRLHGRPRAGAATLAPGRLIDPAPPVRAPVLAPVLAPFQLGVQALSAVYGGARAELLRGQRAPGSHPNLGHSAQCYFWKHDL